MTYENARVLLASQDRSLRKVNNTRFVHGKYEYKILYEGGFAAFVGIYRREVGKRNFKYWNGFGAYHCSSATEVLDKAMSKIRSVMGVC